MSEINLFSSPRINFNYLRKHQFSGTWSQIEGYTLGQTIGIDEHDLLEIEASLAERQKVRDSIESRSAGSGSIGPTAKNPDRFEIAYAEQPEMTTERQRVWAEIERRQNQGSFRSALLAEYGGRCAVTRTACEPVLEAAHIVPFAEGRPDRDNPSNGLLLRADVHTLFDRGLLAIDPDTLRVWVAPFLNDTSYNRLADKEVATSASKKCLRTHFNWALSQAESSTHHN